MHVGIVLGDPYIIVTYMRGAAAVAQRYVSRSRVCVCVRSRIAFSCESRYHARRWPRRHHAHGGRREGDGWREIALTPWSEPAWFVIKIRVRAGDSANSATINGSIPPRIGRRGRAIFIITHSAQSHLPHRHSRAIRPRIHRR